MRWQQARNNPKGERAITMPGGNQPVYSQNKGFKSYDSCGISHTGLAYPTAPYALSFNAIIFEWRKGACPGGRSKSGGDSEGMGRGGGVRLVAAGFDNGHPGVRQRKPVARGQVIFSMLHACHGKTLMIAGRRGSDRMGGECFRFPHSAPGIRSVRAAGRTAASKSHDGTCDSRRLLVSRLSWTLCDCPGPADGWMCGICPDYRVLWLIFICGNLSHCQAVTGFNKIPSLAHSYSVWPVPH